MANVLQCLSNVGLVCRAHAPAMPMHQHAHAPARHEVAAMMHRCAAAALGVPCIATLSVGSSLQNIRRIAQHQHQHRLSKSSCSAFDEGQLLLSRPATLMSGSARSVASCARCMEE
ncbi:hypothetical protein ABPG75_008593 [Micractinium tetrahymenae]